MNPSAPSQRTALGVPSVFSAPVAHWNSTLPIHTAPIAKAYLVILLSVHAVMLAWGATCHSPTVDEVAHLPAGLSHLLLGKFDLYCVNPPLVRTVAALPLLVAGAETSWDHYFDAPRPEFSVGLQFLQLNGGRIQWLFVLGRWACIPFSLLGAYVCFRWAQDLYGRLAGVLAVTLWCFCPNVLGHGQLLTPDVGASALGLCAAYLFWRWLRSFAWKSAMPAGICMGLALLAKATWVILFALWPCVWCSFGLRGRIAAFRQCWMHQIKQLFFMLFVGVLTLNVGYGFEGFGCSLGSFQFYSNALRGTTGNEPGNRFRDQWLGGLPVPLPANFVIGIDLQKREFEMNRPCYLRGEWRHGGWWYYYLYGLMIKVPIGSWLLLLGAAIVGSTSDTRHQEIFLLICAGTVLVFVSLHTGINRHLRYALPALPFVYVWCARLGACWSSGGRSVKVFVSLALFWSTLSSLLVYPHTLSYFNELVGGPVGGHAHLLNSNIDWGQDLLYLRQWMQKHTEAAPLYLAYDGAVDPSLYAIKYKPIGIIETAEGTNARLVPGWFAVSVNYLRDRSARYSVLLRLRPFAMAGYSIYIYNVTNQDLERIRQKKV